MGVELEVIEKRGSFYNYGDLRLAQGRENAKAFLAENLEIAQEIESQIRAEFDLAPLSDVKMPDEEVLDETDEETSGELDGEEIDEPVAILELED
jgi:recombination protein RecA